MTTVPGYLVTITAFLPADPVEHRRMADASLLLDRLPAMLSELGLAEVAVEPRFVARHKLPSPPSAPDPAEPTQPLDHAPAGTVAGGASEEPHDPPTAHAINGLCKHQNQKRYGGGAIVCLDCQAIVAEAGAA